jgi:anthranilate synthase/aminodeoxychorismate synthase-like glutamine amidotransferase
MTPKILLIDNYDSFTYNIAHYFGILGYAIEVVKNDDPELKKLALLDHTHIVLSPGPGSPQDSGFSLEVIRDHHQRLPMLGICLGHQCLGQFFGAQVGHAEKVMHGKISSMFNDGSSIFTGLSKSFNIVRYHSLIIKPDSLPPCLKVIAWTQDSQQKAQEIMAIRHRDYPLFGVQYHPEAILTEYGLEVLKNFVVTTI